ncbi:MAG: hypothetical protein ACTSR8_07155 [Promethearchaeota archaeon]
MTEESLQELELHRFQRKITFLFIGGILMIISSISGTIALHYIIVQTASGLIDSEQVGQYFMFFLVFCSIIADSGGFAVILGTILIILNHYKMGRVIVTLGTGVGLIGLLFLVSLQLGSGMYNEVFGDLIYGLSSLSGFIGIFGYSIVILARKNLEYPEVLEEPRKINLKEYTKKENISKVIALSMSIFFSVILELVLISVYSRLLFLRFTDFLFWQLGIISFSLLIIFALLYSKYFRLIYLFSVLILSIVGFIFLSYGELFLTFNLFYPRLFLIILIISSGLGTSYKIRHFKKFVRKEMIKEIGFLLLAFFSLFAVSVVVLAVPNEKITITPKTEPELIFFTNPFEMPKASEANVTYEKWGNGSFSFYPSMQQRNIYNTGIMERLKTAIKYDFNLYINIIPSGGDFVNIYNTDEILEVYLECKDWFITEGIFNDSHIVAFTIDAEPPKIINEEAKEGTFSEGASHIFKRFPTKEDIEGATDDLNEFVKQIRSDGKQAGIIRTRTNLDNTDGDGDIELLSNNVYSLDVEWDFSVSMLYRSQKFEERDEGSANDYVATILSTVYGAEVTETSYVYSKYYFYLYVGIDQTKSDINAKEQYTFLGNYKSEFERTEYIKNGEYIDDLDICRHFNEEKVFLYNYEGFIYHFGYEGICDLIKHNKQYDSWEFETPALEAQTHVILLMFLIIIDYVLFLDPS